MATHTLSDLRMGLDRSVEHEARHEGHNAVSRYIPVERMTAEDDREALELLRDAFGGEGPGWFALPVAPADHWQWKVHDFPGDAWWERIEHEGRVAGMIVARWWPWLVRGELVPRRDGVDLGFHPSLQGVGFQGARYRLLRARRAELMATPFTLGVGSHPTAAHLATVHHDRPVANELRTMLRVLDPAQMVRRQAAAPPAGGARTMVNLRARRSRLPRPAFLRRARWELLHRRASLLQRPRGLPRLRPTWSIRTIGAFDARTDAFCEQASEAFDLIQYRDRRYLNWRYLDPRGGPFVVSVAEEGGELLGYAATAMAGHQAKLADVLTLPGREDVARTLVSDAVRQAREAGKSSIRAWLPEHHPATPALREHAFFPVRAPGILTYNDETPDGALAFLDEPRAAVHFMLGDTDAI